MQVADDPPVPVTGVAVPQVSRVGGVRCAKNNLPLVLAEEVSAVAKRILPQKNEGLFGLGCLDPARQINSGVRWVCWAKLAIDQRERLPHEIVPERRSARLSERASEIVIDSRKLGGS